MTQLVTWDESPQDAGGLGDDLVPVEPYAATPAPTMIMTGQPSPPRPDDDDGAASTTDDDGSPATNGTAVDDDDADDGPSYHTTACLYDCNCTTTKVPVLNGLDVVSPFHGNLLQGSHEYAYSYKGYKWYFKNSVNMNAFIDDPARYEPRYGGFCAYGLSTEFAQQGFDWSASNLGPPVDTAVYRIYNDYLYFFMSDAVVESFVDNGLNYSITTANARWRGWFPDHDDETFNTRCNCKYSSSESFECMWRR